mgnify:FL=1
MEIMSKVKHCKNKNLYIIVETKFTKITIFELKKLSGLVNISVSKLEPRVKTINLREFDFAICKIHPSPYPYEVEHIIELVNQNEIIQFI